MVPGAVSGTVDLGGMVGGRADKVAAGQLPPVAVGAVESWRVITGRILAREFAFVRVDGDEM